MRAADEGHLEVVNQLLAAGASKEITNRIKRTALSFSAEMGHIDVVERLLEAGANKNVVSDVSFIRSVEVDIYIRMCLYINTHAVRLVHSHGSSQQRSPIRGVKAPVRRG
jgi:ankyrin repeat protein